MSAREFIDVENDPGPVAADPNRGKCPWCGSMITDLYEYGGAFNCGECNGIVEIDKRYEYTGDWRLERGKGLPRTEAHRSDCTALPIDERGHELRPTPAPAVRCCLVMASYGGAHWLGEDNADPAYPNQLHGWYFATGRRSRLTIVCCPFCGQRMPTPGESEPVRAGAMCQGAPAFVSEETRARWVLAHTPKPVVVVPPRVYTYNGVPVAATWEEFREESPGELIATIRKMYATPARWLAAFHEYRTNAPEPGQRHSFQVTGGLVSERTVVYGRLFPTWNGMAVLLHFDGSYTPVTVPTR